MEHTDIFSGKGASQKDDNEVKFRGKSNEAQITPVLDHAFCDDEKNKSSPCRNRDRSGIERKTMVDVGIMIGIMIGIDIMM